MTNILYIDTSGKYSLIMLFNEQGILAVKNTTSLNEHAQFINIHIQEVVEETGIPLSSLHAVCVMNGPGSYTGLRIGLASAKGICYAFNTPLILLNQLDLMCACHTNHTHDSAYIIKARENEYFFTSDAIQSSQAALKSTEELEEYIQTNQYKLFTSDELLLKELSYIQYIPISHDCIKRVVFTHYLQKNLADLMHSEPFYLKNVYINKINKL